MAVSIRLRPSGFGGLARLRLGAKLLGNQGYLVPPRRRRAPSPACEGGLGWGCFRALDCSCGESFPHPDRISRCDIAEAKLRRSYRRTAAEGGLCSPASGRGEATQFTPQFSTLILASLITGPHLSISDF